MYIYIHVFLKFINTYTHINIYIYVHIYVCIYINIYIYIYIYIFIYIYRPCSGSLLAHFFLSPPNTHKITTIEFVTYTYHLLSTFHTYPYIPIYTYHLLYIFLYIHIICYSYNLLPTLSIYPYFIYTYISLFFTHIYIHLYTIIPFTHHLRSTFYIYSISYTHLYLNLIDIYINIHPYSTYICIHVPSAINIPHVHIYA